MSGTDISILIHGSTKSISQQIFYISFHIIQVEYNTGMKINSNIRVYSIPILSFNNNETTKKCKNEIKNIL